MNYDATLLGYISVFRTLPFMQDNIIMYIELRTKKNADDGGPPLLYVT